MFDLLVQYGPFLMAAFLLNISPGPDMAYIVGQTAVHGRKIGLFSSFGVVSGAFVHVLAAALGLSAILATSALAFAIVKWVGVAYLVWLGIGALRASFAGKPGRDGNDDSTPAIAISTRPMTVFQAWRQGVMIDVLNPKVAIFFMAFLPQFVDPQSGDGAMQFLVLGSVVNLIGLVVESSLVLMVAAAAVRIRGHRKLGAWLQRALGAMFIALGARLAISQQ
ncbi:LysE family translocator [Thalassospira sp. GO-4]|jgi:threonine/homoserine/homoserine lactone efflux protein|uniref:LysE family translocator n=1 Tax=Thalassospira sp. GO-4 TaxID=2946605 RepID=UPI002024516F|nr:LysE family translocator [Thalassospira sp. GO-4]URK16978.1 LysE family translocator [Thalassospira sp. GO-4]